MHPAQFAAICGHITIHHITHYLCTHQADSIKAQVDEFRSAASNRTEHMEERLSRVQAAYEQTKR